MNMLRRHHPFFDLDRLVHDGFNIIGTPQHIADIATDIYEEKNSVIVEMQVPGFGPDKIDIKTEGKHLHVKGVRQETIEEKDRHYYRKEIRSGEFERIVELPCDVEGEKARADIKDGILRILLPKKETVKSTKIPVTPTR